MKIQNKIALAISAAALTVTASWAMLSAPTITTKTAAIVRAADVAYRDGLYLAKVHAADGTNCKVSVGRWRTEQDRQSFAEGYQAGSAQEGLAAIQGPALGK